MIGTSLRGRRADFDLSDSYIAYWQTLRKSCVGICLYGGTHGRHGVFSFGAGQTQLLGSARVSKKRFLQIWVGPLKRNSAPDLGRSNNLMVGALATAAGSLVKVRT